jgi:hypothetical protein
VTAFIKHGHQLFNIRQKQNEQGYTVLTYPISYHLLTVILFLLSGILLFILLCYTKPEEFLLGLIATLFFFVCSLFSFFVIKNTQIKYNTSEIIAQNAFKKTSILFWNDCQIRGLNPISQQICIYSSETKIKISVNLMGFDSLVLFLEEKFSVSRKDLRL